MNKSKLQSAIAAFVKNKKANAAYYDDTFKQGYKQYLYPSFFCSFKSEN